MRSTAKEERGPDLAPSTERSITRANPLRVPSRGRPAPRARSSEVAHHVLTHAHHDALKTDVARFRSAPPQLPRLRLPPLRPSTSALLGCFPGSFFMVLRLLSVPSCFGHRPASGPPPFPPGLTCPVFVCRSRKGVQREAVGPLPRKPRRRAKSRPEAGRRPVDLQASTLRDQYPRKGAHALPRRLGSSLRGAPPNGWLAAESRIVGASPARWALQ